MHESDVEAAIEEIRKEIIESRGLIIKTNHLSNSLAADIKSIAKRQAGYERRFTWNSVAAYCLFAALAFFGLKLASGARISEIESEKEAFSVQLEDLRKELQRETRRNEARRQMATQATEFYELIRKRQRAEVIERYDKLDADLLSPTERVFFRDTVEQFRLDLSMQALQSGLDLMRTKRYAQATKQFQLALKHHDQGSHVPSVRYHLAEALGHLGRHKEALHTAQQVTEQTVDRDLQDDAMWLASEYAVVLGDLDQARDTLRTIVRRWPKSSYAPMARRQIQTLNMRIRRGRSG